MLFNFEQYVINEGREDKIEKIYELFEEDLLHQDFIHKIFGQKEFVWEDEYEVDNDIKAGDGGNKRIVWIEIYNPTKEAMESLDKNYGDFAKPFEEWAKKHNLNEPEIMSTDDSMSFVVTL